MQENFLQHLQINSDREDYGYSVALKFPMEMLGHKFCIFFANFSTKRKVFDHGFQIRMSGSSPPCSPFSCHRYDASGDDMN